jgi:hypothetical protein
MTAITGKAYQHPSPPPTRTCPIWYVHSPPAGGEQGPRTAVVMVERLEEHAERAATSGGCPATPRPRDVRPFRKVPIRVIL